VPDLVPAAMTADPGLFARCAVEALGGGSEEVLVVGHSAAGSVLPVVAGLTPHVSRVVFVDATVPPCEGTCSAGGDFLAALQALAVNGTLPPWSQWWGDGVLPALVVDDVRRGEIEAELPTVPLAFFEAPIALPAGWCAGDGGFVLLTEFYRSDATRASERGWPVLEHLGDHLDMATQEDAIADILVGLADRA
jgi:hypothetical protein